MGCRTPCSVDDSPVGTMSLIVERDEAHAHILPLSVSGSCAGLWRTACLQTTAPRLHSTARWWRSWSGADRSGATSRKSNAGPSSRTRSSGASGV